MSTPDPVRNPPGAPPTPPPAPTSPSSHDPQPTQQPTHQLAQQQRSADAERAARMRALAYKLSLGVCVACPLVALLPPRRWDLFTFGLGVAFCTSAGFALQERTGRGLLWHVSSRLPGVQRKQREREQREREREREEEEVMKRWREEEARQVKERGTFKRAWVGGAGGEDAGDWVDERAVREREAAREGRGRGSLIFEQVKEAFGVKSEVDEDDDDEDED